MGVLGFNGSGKSTLMKMMCGITRPSAGRVDVYGRTVLLGGVGLGMSGELTGGQLLLRTLILRRLLRRHVLADNEQYVGVLLPPSNGGVMVNMALALDRRIAVNLNYTVTANVMNACIERAASVTCSPAARCSAS